MALGSNDAAPRRHNRPSLTNTALAAPPGPAEHLSKVAEILAIGFMRLAGRKSSANSADTRDSSLDNSPGESGYPTMVKRRPSDD